MLFRYGNQRLLQTLALKPSLQVAGYGIENEILSEITAITFDGSLIRDGAVISLSYGATKEDRIRFTQKLQLKAEGGNQ